MKRGIGLFSAASHATNNFKCMTVPEFGSLGAGSGAWFRGRATPRSLQPEQGSSASPSISSAKDYLERIYESPPEDLFFAVTLHQSRRHHQQSQHSSRRRSTPFPHCSTIWVLQRRLANSLKSNASLVNVMLGSRKIKTQAKRSNPRKTAM